jgi:flagellar biosynthetic protein FliR
MSLTSALVQDPVVEQQSSTLSGFLTTLGLTLIFVSGLDHLMLHSLIDSYALFPLATPPSLGDANDLIVGTLTQAFAIGLQLSMPSLIVGLVCNIVLGLLGRLMPQFSVFFFGLPIQLSIQLWVTVLTISGIMLLFTKYLSETLKGFIG